MTFSSVPHDQARDHRDPVLPVRETDKPSRPGPEIFWTREAIIEALRRWEQRHGRAPSGEDWDAAGPGHPSSVTVRARFGTLEAARQEAGVTFRRKNCAGQWTRDTIAEAYVRFVFLNGRQPIQDEWRIPTEDTPGLATIRRLYGSWNIMVASIGYPPRYMRRSIQGYLNAGRTRVTRDHEDGWEERRNRYLALLRETRS